MKINNIYNNKGVQKQIKNILEKEGSIQLQDFLKELPKLKINFKKEYKPQSHSYKISNYNLSKEIKLFIENITGKKISSSNIFEFKHKDYTLLNDKNSEKKVYKIILELTENWKEEFGGFTSFIKYNKELFRINPIYNSLAIVKTNKEMKSFVKYINNKAKNHQIIKLNLN